MSDPLDRPASPATVHGLADAGLLDRDAAIAALQQGPDAATWVRMADHTLAFAGAALLGAAAIYLVAFNWAEIGRLAHFGLVAAPLGAATVFGAWRFPAVAGKAAMLASFLLTGALLALFGQTYQTGADPYQLFGGWAALTLLWALAADMPVLWGLQAVLWNVTLVLWWIQVLQRPGTRGFVDLVHAVTVLNLAAWLASEIASRFYPPLRARWLPRLLSFAALAPCAVTAASWTVSAEIYKEDAWVAAPLLALLLVLSVPLGRRDTGLWAIAGMAVLVQTTGVCGRVLWEIGAEADNALAWSFLLGMAGIVVSVQGGLLAWAVRAAHRRFASEALA